MYLKLVGSNELIYMVRLICKVAWKQLTNASNKHEVVQINDV